MVELYGIRIDYFQKTVGESFESERICELVATFDTEEKAKEYVKKSELVSPSALYRFRKNSVLRNYTDYEITSPQTISVPNNPTI